jgi:hypothetical protein
MADRPDTLPQEIMDAESFIHDILSDTTHPIHNRSHPRHLQSIQALDEMMKRLDEMRQEWLLKDSG